MSTSKVAPLVSAALFSRGLAAGLPAQDRLAHPGGMAERPVIGGTWEASWPKEILALDGAHGPSQRTADGESIRSELFGSVHELLMP